MLWLLKSDFNGSITSITTHETNNLRNPKPELKVRVTDANLVTTAGNVDTSVMSGTCNPNLIMI